jgi:hypothetical protein
MRQIVGFSAGCLGFIGAVLLIVWFMGAFDGAGLGFHGWIALGLGTLFTTALGVALMALVFYSARSGQDDSAGGAKR